MRGRAVLKLRVNTQSSKLTEAARTACGRDEQNGVMGPIE
jgi:hypothetical protein